MPEWLVSLFLLLVPLSYLYAIVRHNLFGIDHLLNRALVYVLLSLGIFAIFLGPLLLLYRLLPGDVLLQAMVVAALTLLVGLTFDRTRAQVQHLVDKIFYGGWYDYPGVVETVSGALARCLEPEQLAGVLTRQVPDLMQLHPGQLWIGEPNQSPNLPIYQSTNLPIYQFTFQGHVRGLWTVGQRRDGDDFSAADRRILETLARQAEVALGNVLLVEILRRQLDEIRAIQRQLLRSREEERARLARDLHDRPIQALVGLNLQLGLLLAGGDNPSLAEALKDMRAEVRQLLGDLRQVCVELRPPMLDALGLGAALRALAGDWSAQSGVEMRLELPPDATLRPLPDEVAVNLYRVVQEALSNVIRHAEARQVTIQLAWEDSRLILTVHDDGRGFVVPTAFQGLAAQGHFGLVSMQERVELVGGVLTVESAPGWGTTVRVVKNADFMTATD
jgi:signal transduction histidine kinase